MIGRKTLGPRKIALAFEVERDIWFIDPAIDVPKSDLAKYKESGFDTSSLVYKAGEKPSLFLVRPLTRRQKDAAEALNLRETYEWYIRCGVTSFENYQIQAEDGSMMEAPQPDAVQSGVFGAMASEKWLDDINFPTLHLTALGSIIQRISEADIPLARVSAPRAGPSTSSEKATTDAK